MKLLCLFFVVAFVAYSQPAPEGDVQGMAKKSTLFGESLKLPAGPRKLQETRKRGGRKGKGRGRKGRGRKGRKDKKGQQTGGFGAAAFRMGGDEEPDRKDRKGRKGRKGRKDKKGQRTGGFGAAAFRMDGDEESDRKDRKGRKGRKGRKNKKGQQTGGFGAAALRMGEESDRKDRKGRKGRKGKKGENANGGFGAAAFRIKANPFGSFVMSTDDDDVVTTPNAVSLNRPQFGFGTPYNYFGPMGFPGFGRNFAAPAASIPLYGTNTVAAAPAAVPFNSGPAFGNSWGLRSSFGNYGAFNGFRGGFAGGRGFGAGFGGRMQPAFWG